MTTKGLISRIQKYSIKDGPGIRSTVFFAGCNLKCLWCANPELISDKKELMYYPVRCKLCGNCVKTDKTNSMRIEDNKLIINRNEDLDINIVAEACYHEALEIIGTEITVDELVDKLLRDKEFYQHSGGGVTFSGGEAALQGDFVIEVAGKLRDYGIHTALDTAGYISWEILKPIVESVDAVLFDLKVYDRDIHQKYTGVDNKLIFENIRKISEIDKDIYLRLIVVPGVNDNMEDISERLKIAASLGSAVKKVDLLKYHNLGESKYTSLGKEYLLKDIGKVDEELIEKAMEYGKDLGLEMSVGG